MEREPAEASDEALPPNGEASKATPATESPETLVEEETGDLEPSDVELPAAISRLDERLEESQRLLARQTDLVDRLHSENQALRAGELRNAQLPLIRDLLRLHDDVGRMRAAAGDAGDSANDLRLVQESLTETLARNGVEAFAPDCTDPFDPRLHAVAGLESIEDETLDKSVAEVIRQGFRWESGGTIRVAEVRAYRYMDSE